MPYQIRSLLSEEDISARVALLANDINTYFKDSQRLVVIGLLRGALVFMADLCRQLTGNVELEVMSVSSYGNGTEPADLKIIQDIRADIEGADVLLVDDIVDTGNTLVSVSCLLAHRKPRRLALAALLDKPSRRQVPIEVQFVGFEIPDVFVVGYGIDYAQQYRHLPYIGQVEPSQNF